MTKEIAMVFCLPFLLFFPRLGSSYEPMELLSHLAHTAYPRAADLFCGGHLPFYKGFGSLNEAGKHSHAIDQQATIGRMMDAGLNVGTIQAQIPSLDHLR